MSVYAGGRKALLCRGDRMPASLYRGGKFIAGAKWRDDTGRSLRIETPYQGVLRWPDGIAGRDEPAWPPTPEAPAAIRCVRAGTQIRSAGKNLCAPPYYSCSNDAFGLRYAIKAVSYVPGVSYGIIDRGYCAVLPIVPGTTYSFSQMRVATSDGQPDAVKILATTYAKYEDCFTNSAGLILRKIDDAGTVTAQDGEHWIVAGVAFYPNRTGTFAITENLMANVGTAAEPYEPCRSGGTVTIGRDLHQWDSFRPLTGRYTVGSGIDLITSSGNLSLNSNYASETVNCFIANMEPIGEDFDSRAVKPCWCNIAGFQKTGWDSKLPNTFCVQSASANGRRIVWFFVSAAAYPALSDFKSMLDRMESQGTPVTVVYQLAAPYTVQGDAHGLRTVPGVTNLFSVLPDGDGLYPELDVRAAILGA